ncbi:MAG: type II toxin-antitoxin system HicB family antitoxin [Acidobacteriota bacterium]
MREAIRLLETVIEKGDDSYGAYVPDLPGCVAVAKTREEVERLIAEGIAIHLDSLREHGEQVPLPTSTCEYIEPLARAS